MASHLFFLGALILVSTYSIGLASDPDPLQDFCVANPNPTLVKAASSLFSFLSGIRVNGFLCKDPKHVNENDFFFSGLNASGNTSNAVGSKVTPVTATQIPGLNTLGISMARVDFAPFGINPPHVHPRATEILTVLEGSLEVGFVTSNPGNKQITTTLRQGDVFVFPEGLVHYQYNNANATAVAIVGLSSQNPGVITVANAVFGSNPAIPDNLLAKAFQVDNKTVDTIQSKF